MSEFDHEASRIDSDIAMAEKLAHINRLLIKYNWIFLHPYSHGIDVDILKEILSKANVEEKVMTFFGHRFFDLRITIYFIDGFYKRQPFLKDFAGVVEESVILCLQQDFRGAISVLLPTIEGIFRKFLVQNEGGEWSRKSGVSLIKACIASMTNAYVELCKTYLTKRYALSIQHGRYFTIEQETTILEKEKKYFKIWIDQLEQYLTHNLYHDTLKSNPKDKFNRHHIFHAIDSIDFSFANYLRLFNCINFISWAISSTTYESSPIPEAREEDVFEKYKNYLKVLIISESIRDTKARTLGKQSENFMNFLDAKYQDIVAIPKAQIVEALSTLDTAKYQQDWN